MDLTRVGQTGRTLGSELDTEDAVWNVDEEYQNLTERNAWAVYCLSKLSGDPSMLDDVDIATQLACMTIQHDIENILLGETTNAGDRFKRLAESYDKSLAQDDSEKMKTGIAESKLFLKACALLCDDDAGIDCSLDFDDYLAITSSILEDLAEFEDPMPGVNLYPQTVPKPVRIAPVGKQRPGTATRVKTKTEWSMSDEHTKRTKDEIKTFLTTVASWKPDWDPDAVLKFQSDIWDFTEKATNHNKGLPEVKLLRKYYEDRSNKKAPTENQAIQATEAAFRLWLRAADVPEPSEVDESATSDD